MSKPNGCAENGRGLLGSNTRNNDHPDAERDRRVIERFAMQSVARELLPGERVAECLRAIVPGQAHVKIMHSPSVMRAHYKHLLVCASVWNCPVCAAKISERRRVELTAALDRNDELVPALLTFTVQHTRAHPLKETLAALLAAYKRMCHGKAWEGFRDRFGLIGTVRALEVTYTLNGWHAHTHTLALFDDRPNEDELHRFLSGRWIASVRKTGRFASDGHGCNVEFRKKAIGNYVSKFGEQWGIEHELVKAVSKVSKSDKGMTPFGLLADYLAGNKASGRRFVEYAQAFKGCRQLVWSKGLRSKLGIGEAKSDEVIAKEIEQDAVLLAMLSRLQWRRILANDIRGELLAVAHQGDVDKVWSFLAEFGIERYQVGESVARPRLPSEQ